MELAFTLPIFLAMIFGMIEFGRGIMAHHVVNNAARIGARSATVDGSTTAQVEARAKAHCQTGLGVAANRVTVTVSVSPDGSTQSSGLTLANAKTGDICTVRVQVSVDDISFMPPQFLKGLTLSGSCAMEHE